MVTPVGKPGLNPEKDVSVPINWAYNHVREIPLPCVKRASRASSCVVA